jgi:inhibitor of cysteine peptidase
MLRKFYCLAAILLALISFQGFAWWPWPTFPPGPFPTAQPTPQIQPTPAPVPETVKIGEADNGKTIFIAKGTILELSLDTNPSTGYGWQFVQEPDPDILRLEDHYLTFKDPTEPPKPGDPEIEYWIYRAVGEGWTTISLEYLRPWETVPPIKTFRVTIVVTN